MALQFNFFDGAADQHPVLEGFRYQRELIKPSEESALVAQIRELPFEEFDFHGFKGKRRVVSFGLQYDFSGGGRLSKANDIPEFLLALRDRTASFANLNPEGIQPVLVTEYSAGAGIGWHRDKAVFGQVVAISLLAPCVLRFRRKVEEDRSAKERSLRQSVRLGEKWDRVNVLVEPRSVYSLRGPARLVWEHSILRVDSLRYSITFRNLREE